MCDNVTLPPGWVPIELLGSGAFGAVFRAERCADGARFALKACKPQPDSDCVGLPFDFVREAAVYAHLGEGAERRVPALRDALVSAGCSPVLVLEEAPMSLAFLIKRRHIDRAIMRRVAHDLAEALAFLHERDVIHRDVKPNNVLYDHDAGCKLCDFGLARRLVPGRALTLEVCTLWYRPPEVMLGKADYDGSLDVWSLGMTLLQVAGGKPKVDEGSQYGCLTQIFQMLGTPGPQRWSAGAALPLFHGQFPNFRGQPRAIELHLGKHADAVSFVAPMLSLDPAERPSAPSLLAHAFVAPRAKRARTCRA